MLVQMPQHQGHTVQKAANHTACPNTAKTRRESYLQLGMLEHAKQKLCGQPARGIPGQRGSKRLRQGQDAHPTAKPSSCGCPAKAMATDGHTSSPGALVLILAPWRGVSARGTPPVPLLFCQAGPAAAFT